MKKIMLIALTLMSAGLIWAAPAAKTKTAEKQIIEKPVFNEPNSIVFDLQKISTKDKIIVSDFSNDSNNILTVYLWDGKSWQLASRYKPSDISKSSNKIYFSSLQALIKINEDAELKRMNAVQINSVYTGNLSQFNFAAVTVTNPAVNVECGSYKNDLYFVLTKSVNPKVSLANAVSIDSNSIQDFKTYIDSNGKVIERKSNCKVSIINISKNYDFCTLVYGKTNSSEEYDYLGLSYLYQIGQEDELNTMGRNIVDYDTLYFVTDNGIKQNAEVVCKNNKVFIVLK